MRILTPKRTLCKNPNAQFTITGNGIPISSNGTHFQYCPFFGSHLWKFSIWNGTQTGNLPLLVLRVTHLYHFRDWATHFWYWAMPFPEWSFTGPLTRTGLYARDLISGTGLCQFRYGCVLGPVPKLDSMRVVPFPVPGSASSGTVVFRVLYQN